MKSKCNIYLFFSTEEEASKTMAVLEKEYPKNFSQKSKIIAGMGFNNVEQDFIDNLKKLSNTSAKFFFLDWFSDSISETGYEFYDYEKKYSAEMSQSLCLKGVGKIMFLLSCGLEEFIEGFVFDGIS